MGRLLAAMAAAAWLAGGAGLPAPAAAQAGRGAGRTGPAAGAKASGEATEQPTGPDRSDSHTKALKAAMDAGKCVLVVYTRETHVPAAMAKQSFMLTDPVTRRTVHPHFVVAEIPISQGGDRYLAFRRKYAGDDLPFWAVMTPEGELLDGGDRGSVGTEQPNDWRKRLLAIARRCPPISRKTRKAAAKLLDEAENDLASAEYPKVHAAVRKLAKLWFPKELVERQARLERELTARGEALLARGDALAKSKPVEAALAYDKAQRQFTLSLPAGKEGRKRLAALLAAHKEIRKEFESRKRSVEAEELLERARRLESVGQARRARGVYEGIARRYADTASAAAARRAAARLAQAAGPATRPAGDKDPAGPGGKDDEAQAQRLVRLATSYHLAKLDDKAKEKLAACLRQYPKTKAAKEAARLLKAWRLGDGE